MAATPRDYGTSTPNTEDISVDIARRLDELEKIMEAGWARRSRSQPRRKQGLHSLDFSQRVHEWGSATRATHQLDPAPPSSCKADLEAKLAKLEQVLADSPRASPQELRLASQTVVHRHLPPLPSYQMRPNLAASPAMSQLSVSALAESATGTMDEELTNRLDRLEQLLGPVVWT